MGQNRKSRRGTSKSEDLKAALSSLAMMAEYSEAELKKISPHSAILANALKQAINEDMKLANTRRGYRKA